MESISDETQRLRRCLHDLTALSALPAAWVGFDRRRIGEHLADVLARMLRLDLVLVRAAGSAEAPVPDCVRTADAPLPAADADKVRRALAPWLNPDGAAVASLRNPLGDGALRVAAAPMGTRGQCGMLVAASRRPDFPTEEERLCLGVAADRAACCLRQKQAEEALAAREEEALREADRQKNAFLSMLAHELRNPLVPISNAVQLLRLCGPITPELEEIRALIGRQVQHLVRLVDDLLDVSRITSGRIRLQSEVVDLAVIVARAVETSRSQVESRRHALDVAPPAEPLWVQGDPVRLAQVLSNLLDNAAKYTPEGGRIGLSLGREGDEAVLRVRDTGVGIPPEMLSSMFSLFTQLERPLDRSQGGLGIGLTLVQQLVLLHGGRVEAFSAGTGQGSEFVVYLPVLERDSPPEPAAAAPEGSAADSRRRVLVVEDHKDAARSLAHVLRLSGYVVEVCHDGPSALKIAPSFQPEIVLLDIGLPGMDGYEVARRLRAMPGPGQALLMAVTGYGQPEDFRRSREAGFDQHLVKPVNSEALMARLASYLCKH